MGKILLVEDDLDLCELLTELLQMEGFELTSSQNGREGLELALKQEFDLLLLDVMLPEMNGFEVLKSLRQHSQLPVLMLTARGDDIDRVVGLEIGADDYLPKPFNDRELVARIKAILRRTHDKADPQTDQISAGDLTLFPGRQEVWHQQESITLTSTEFSLLHALLSQAGQIVSKEELSVSVLNKKLMPFDRSLDMHLSNLRRKLPERTDGRPRVKTVRGKGYIWLE
ncbi:two component transcriptional regulator, winged helix family [Ferrimonas sediminum]|uniref:Two component transcriptional regulator, winged helix family n=1 Tax=Ferrimonas sediminum TaxID=718193 RepID=A0A1G8XHU4_9GAMM|nr:response regulator [Ferrimonas sediminum]SDJ90179.1 two component transcriptional regulator, winged helix family [Ferrimonas sediminum]